VDGRLDDEKTEREKGEAGRAGTKTATVPECEEIPAQGAVSSTMGVQASGGAVSSSATVPECEEMPAQGTSEWLDVWEWWELLDFQSRTAWPCAGVPESDSASSSSGHHEHWERFFRRN